MKYALIGLLVLGGCTTPPVSDFGTADEHFYKGNAWYIADRRGQLEVALMAAGIEDPEIEYRGAARDYLLSNQRVCSVGPGRSGGEGRYLFNYSCR